MRKSLTIVAASLMLLAAACNKEENTPITFTAGIEQCSGNGKLHLDGNLLKWQTTDAVYVRCINSDGQTNTGCDVTPQGDGTWATLTPRGYIASQGTYTAYYPLASASFGTGFVMPYNRIGVIKDELSDMPMVAQSTTTTFQFHNLCGALKLHVQSAGTSLKRIYITTPNGEPIAGRFDIDFDDYSMTLINNSLIATNAIRSYIVVPIYNEDDITDGADYYIYFLPGTYSGMTITLEDVDGKICTKSATTAVTVERNKIHPISFSGNLVFETPTTE